MKKCNCKITSDGCRYCQPQEYIDYLEKYITDLQDKHLIRYDKNQLINIIKQEALKHSYEPFKLSSGQMSNFYIDLKKITLNPEVMTLVGNLIYNEIKDLDVQGIGGLTFGADPISIATSLICYQNNKHIKAFSIRKQTKSHGTNQFIEGSVKSGDKVIIIEDVITTGKSVLQAIDKALTFGLEPIKIIALVNRSNVYIDNLTSIINIKELANE